MQLSGERHHNGSFSSWPESCQAWREAAQAWWLWKDSDRQAQHACGAGQFVRTVVATAAAAAAAARQQPAWPASKRAVTQGSDAQGRRHAEQGQRRRDGWVCQRHQRSHWPQEGSSLDAAPHGEHRYATPHLQRSSLKVRVALCVNACCHSTCQAAASNSTPLSQCAGAAAEHAKRTRPSASRPAVVLPSAMTTHGTKLIRELALRSMPAMTRVSR